MKYLAIALALSLTACTATEEKSIPTKPVDERLPNKEQLDAAGDIFGEFKTIDSLSNEVFLQITENGLFKQITIDNKTKKESIIEGFLKYKPGNSVFSLISNDEKYVFTFLLNENKDLTAINDKGEYTAHGSFLRIIETPGESSPFVVTEGQQSTSEQPKNVPITDPNKLEQIKKMKKASSSK